MSARWTSPRRSSAHVGGADRARAIGSQRAFHRMARWPWRGRRRPEHALRAVDRGTASIEDVTAAAGGPGRVCSSSTRPTSGTSGSRCRSGPSGRVPCAHADRRSPGGQQSGNANAFSEAGFHRLHAVPHARRLIEECGASRCSTARSGERARYHPRPQLGLGEGLKDSISMKLVLKGIVTREDAAWRSSTAWTNRRVESGWTRRRERRASIESLPEVIEAIAGRIPVLVDGGIRRGTDIFKALRSRKRSADRPAVHLGLASFGQPGVEAVLDILRRELVTACGRRAPRRGPDRRTSVMERGASPGPHLDYLPAECVKVSGGRGQRPI